MIAARRGLPSPMDAEQATLHILLVANDPVDARLIRELLVDSRVRFDLEQVGAVEAALERLADAGIDVVLLDLALPDSHGLETLDRVLEKAPAVPVLVLSGLPDDGLAEQAVRAGAQDYLVKGQVDRPLLVRAVRYAIERKRFEGVVEAGRHRLQALFDNSLDAILLADDEGRCVDANRAAEVLTGYTKEELCRLTLSDLIAEPRSEASSDLWNLFITQGELRGEYAIRRRDGTEVEVELRAVADIQPGLHLSFLSDVSERRRAEERLRESEERYRRFFQEDLTGDCIVTPDGRILECNPAFARIFGYDSVEEVMAVDSMSLFPDPEVRGGFLSKLRRLGKIDRYEVEGRRKGGEPVYVIANIIGTFDDGGELVDFRAYLFDDTDRHLAEDQLRQAQKMEAVGQLAGGIAHDFNNLVTAITGYSDLLLMRLGPDAPERHDLLEIKHAGERAAALTRQLLAFSRSQVLRPEVLDLNEVVAGTESMLARVIGEDVRLVTRLDPELGPVRADRGQIEQVLMNLAVNARDAMPRGGRLVLETSPFRVDSPMVRPGVTVVPGEYALLTVTDSGEGMPEATLEHIFEPFFTTKGPGKGTGLGLSTVYGIVKQSGGYIWAYSEPGEGTAFKVYLPRVAPETVRPREEPERAPAGPGQGRILVVEDEDAVRGLIVQILEIHGYDVLEAADGRAALEVCSGNEDGIDLVISDMVMPDIRGPELEKLLAIRAPRARLLFISGYPGHAIVQRGELPAGTPFLQKPFTQQALLDKIRELLT